MLVSPLNGGENQPLSPTFFDLLYTFSSAIFDSTGRVNGTSDWSAKFNPFNPVIKIKFNIPKNRLTKIAIYEMFEREEKTLIN